MFVGIGWTPIHVAATKGDLRMLQVISQYNFHLGPVNSQNGSTPLQVACREKRSDVVRFLLAAGVDPDPIRLDGVSPLHLAVIENSFEIAKMLLDKGTYYT